MYYGGVLNISIAQTSKYLAASSVYDGTVCDTFYSNNIIQIGITERHVVLQQCFGKMFRCENTK